MYNKTSTLKNNSATIFSPGEIQHIIWATTYITQGGPIKLNQEFEPPES